MSRWRWSTVFTAVACFQRLARAQLNSSETAVYTNYTGSSTSSSLITSSSHSSTTEILSTTSSSQIQDGNSNNGSSTRSSLSAGLGSYILSGLGAQGRSSPVSSLATSIDFSSTSSDVQALSSTTGLSNPSGSAKTVSSSASALRPVSSNTTTAAYHGSYPVASNTSATMYPSGTITSPARLSTTYSASNCIPGLDWATLDAQQVMSLQSLESEGTTITACPTGPPSSSVSMYNNKTCASDAYLNPINATQGTWAFHSDECPCGYTALPVSVPYNWYSCTPTRPATLSSTACFYSEILYDFPYGNYDNRSSASYCQSTYYCWWSSSIAYSKALSLGEKTSGVFNITSSLLRTSVSSGTTVTVTPDPIFGDTTITETARTYVSTEFRAQPPCCSSCTLNVATVNVMHWPAATAAGNTSYATTLVSGNFTFTSPSIYFGFTALQASNMCGAVGGQLSYTTVALNPTDVSTLPPFTTSYKTLPDAVTLLTLRGPPERLGSDYFESCTGEYSVTDTDAAWSAAISNVPCHPVFDIPSAIWSMQPQWVASGCQNIIGGLYDPPTALQPTTSEAGPSLPPSPGSTISAVVSSTTPPPAPAPHSTSVQTPSSTATPPAGSASNPESYSTSSGSSSFQPANEATPKASQPKAGPAASSPSPEVPAPEPSPHTSAAAASTGAEPAPTQPQDSGTYAASSATPMGHSSEDNDPAPTASTQTSDPYAGIGSVVAQVGHSSGIVPSDPKSATEASDPYAGIGSVIAQVGHSTPVTGGDPGKQTPTDSPSNPGSDSPSVVPQAPAVLTLGGATVTANSASQFVVGPGQTLDPGEKTTVAGNTISLDPSGSYAVVNGNTQTIASAATQAGRLPAVLTLGSTTFTANSASQFIVGSGQTVDPGQVTTLDGYTVSLDPQASYAVVNGNTQPLIPAAPTLGTNDPANDQTMVWTSNGQTHTVIENSPPVPTATPSDAITIGGTVAFTAISTSNGILLAEGGSTVYISNGAATTFGGHAVSAPTDGGSLVLDGSSTVGVADPGVTPQAVITADGHTITALSGGGSVLLKDGTSSTTVPAGSDATFEGITISAPSQSAAIVIDGTSTIAMSFSSEAVFNVDGHTMTAIANGQSVVINAGVHTVTIADGATAIIDGQVFSAASAGDSIVVDGTATIPLGQPSDACTAATVMTIGDLTLTAIETGRSIILAEGSETITVADGSETMIAGESISIPNRGGVVAVTAAPSQVSSQSTTAGSTSSTKSSGATGISRLNLAGFAAIGFGCAIWAII